MPRKLMSEAEEKQQEVSSTRSYIEGQTFDLISRIKLLNEGDREKIIEEFRAIIENNFRLEE